MLYELIRVKRGKEVLMMRDELPEINKRRKTLTAGNRGGIRGEKVRFVVRESDSNVKFKKVHRHREH